MSKVSGRNLHIFGTKPPWYETSDILLKCMHSIFECIFNLPIFPFGLGIPLVLSDTILTEYKEINPNENAKKTLDNVVNVVIMMGVDR